jgi:hypothetical protein
VVHVSDASGVPPFMEGDTAMLFIFVEATSGLDGYNGTHGTLPRSASMGHTQRFVTFVLREKEAA